MVATKCWLLAALLGLAPAIAHAGEDPNPAVTTDFRAIYFCPSTGKQSGQCPGYTINHWIPLCAGGEDSLANLWWEEIERFSLKYRYELALCHALDHASQGVNPNEAEAWRRYWEAVAAIGDDEAMRVQLDQQ